MIDEAFMPFGEIVERLLAFENEFMDEEAGVHTYVYECEIESPVELDVARDGEGALHVGTTPPLYYERTTFLPSFHRLRLKAEISRGDNGD